MNVSVNTDITELWTEQRFAEHLGAASRRGVTCFRTHTM